MKYTAPLQKQMLQTAATKTGIKAVLNPMQLQTATNASGIKIKQNPLQLIADKSAKPNNNPLPLQSKKENRTGLPDKLKENTEALSGYSMDDVEVHYNSDKPAQLQALAYTKGTEIHVAPGQEKHLPHEAWHVIQQKQGRVKATMQMKGVGINNDKGLEKEADIMGGKALLQGRFYGVTNKFYANTESGNITQTKNDYLQLFGEVIQREEFIGNESSHHMHVGAGVRQPHYKRGKNERSRIDIGPEGNYRLHDLQEVIDLLRDENDPNAQACYNWCLSEANSIHQLGNPKATRRARAKTNAS